MSHAKPPVKIVSPLRVTTIAVAPLSRRLLRAGEEEELREHLRLHGVVGEDGDAKDVARCAAAGAGVDQVMPLLAAAYPAAAVAARRGERAALELERHDSLAGLDADGPRVSAANGDVAAGVDEARPGGGEDVGRALGGVALADPAEIELRAVFELDAAAVDRYSVRRRPAATCAVSAPSGATSANVRS